VESLKIWSCSKTGLEIDCHLISGPVFEHQNMDKKTGPFLKKFSFWAFSIGLITVLFLQGAQIEVKIPLNLKAQIKRPHISLKVYQVTNKEETKTYTLAFECPNIIHTGLGKFIVC
jgi:hypothetical protein